MRHALGAALVQSGRGAEAEQVYRADLAKLPHNGWSLFGLSEALMMQRKQAESEKVRAEFKQVWRQADLQIRSSCLCQPGV